MGQLIDFPTRSKVFNPHYDNDLLLKIIRQVLMTRFSMRHPIKTVDELTALVETYERQVHQARTRHDRGHPYVQEWYEIEEVIDQTIRALEYLQFTLAEFPPVQDALLNAPYRIVTNFQKTDEQRYPVAWIWYPTFFEVICCYCGETVSTVAQKRSRPLHKEPNEIELQEMQQGVDKHVDDCPRAYAMDEVPMGVIKLVGFHL